MTRTLISLLTALLTVSFVAAQPPFKKDGPPFKKSGPKVGDVAPDFELTYLSEKRSFKLSGNFGKKPTLLIFHSFT